MAGQDHKDEAFDLESSAQIELGRQPVRDVGSHAIDQAETPTIRDPHHRQVRTSDREFGLNQFPKDL